MTMIPYIVAYVGIAVFVIAVIARFMMWSQMPIHVRWELYPVAHEGKRAHYGGSYLEETDWWKKPREASLWGEIKAMGAEIIFLVALKEHNPKMWVRSFPFHFGLYLVIGATGLMFFGAILGSISAGLMAGGFGKLIGVLVMALAYGGLGLSLFGAVGLLQQRFTDPELKDFTTPADIFNLLLFIVTFGVCLLHLVVVDPKLAVSMGFVFNLITFNFTALSAQTHVLTTVAVVLLGFTVAYVPLTHMSHFVGKYFAYHAIRWNDDPNLRGSKHEKPIGEVLAYPVSWSGDHIQGDGKKTWADVATDLSSAQEEKK